MDTYKIPVNRWDYKLDEGITCRVPIDTFLEMFTQTEDLEK